MMLSIPSKNGIYIDKLSGARMGNIIEIPKYAHGDQDNPLEKHLNCDWLAVEFMTGLERQNALSPEEQTRTGKPESFLFTKLLKYSVAPGVKVWLVNTFIGSDPVAELKRFTDRFKSIDKTTAFAGVIVRITEDYTTSNRTANAAKIYMEGLKSLGISVGVWASEFLTLPVISVFVSMADFILYDVIWSTSSSQKEFASSYLAWKSMGVKIGIPVFHLQGWSTRNYQFSPQELRNLYYRLMVCDDIPAMMWYKWDGPNSLETNMRVRDILFESKWELITPPAPPIVIPPEVPSNWYVGKTDHDILMKLAEAHKDLK